MPKKTRGTESDQDRLADSLPQFADRIGLSVRAMYAAIARGEGPATIKVGGRRLIRREAGEKWLAARERTGVLSCEVIEDPRALRPAILEHQPSLVNGMPATESAMLQARAFLRDPANVRALRAELERLVAGDDAANGGDGQ